MSSYVFAPASFNKVFDSNLEIPYPQQVRSSFNNAIFPQMFMLALPDFISKKAFVRTDRTKHLTDDAAFN